MKKEARKVEHKKRKVARLKQGRNLGRTKEIRTNRKE